MQHQYHVIEESHRNGASTVFVCDFTSNCFINHDLVLTHNVTSVFRHKMRLVWKPWRGQEMSITKNPIWTNLCCFCQPSRQQFFWMFCQKEEFIMSCLERCFCAYFPAIVISFGPHPSCEPSPAKLLPLSRGHVILRDYGVAPLFNLTPDYCM